MELVEVRDVIMGGRPEGGGRLMADVSSRGSEASTNWLATSWGPGRDGSTILTGRQRRAPRQ
jgi:hypothetical protein